MRPYRLLPSLAHPRPLLVRARHRLIAAALTCCAVAATAAGAAAAVRGPDVSSFQHPYGAAINWSAARAAGASFAFVKATEGTGYTNPYFRSDWTGLTQHGLIRGAYHFARPAAPISSAVAQARFFVSRTGSLRASGDLPAVLDLEVSGGLTPAQLIRWTSTWLATTTALTGRRPIIYSYPYFWAHQMADSHAFTSYPLWIASYGAPPPHLGGWPTWSFWQYTDTASLAGVAGAGAVDMSVFNGSLAQLKALAGVGSAPVGATTSPTPAPAPRAPALPRAPGHTPIGHLQLWRRVPRGVQVAGWALDPDTRAPLRVDFFVNGRFVAGVTANAPSAAVAARWPRYGSRHGFHRTVAVHHGHRMCVYAINHAGAGRNRLLGCGRT